MSASPSEVTNTPIEHAIELMRRHRRATSTVVYSAVTLSALAAAYFVRFEFSLAPEWTDQFWPAAAILVTLRLGVNYVFRMGISRWRYVGTRDVVRLIGAVTVGSAVFFLLTWGLGAGPRVPRSVILLEWVFKGYFTAGLWVLYRMVYERHRARSAPSRIDVLVIGAGEAGQTLAKEMLRSPSGYHPVGFVDDDPFKWGTRVHGVEVVGATQDLPAIADETAAGEIVIAMPSASPEALRRVVELCEAIEAPIKILPGIEEVLEGNGWLSHVRDVQVEDLLGRDPVDLELPELAEALRGKVVLVTGAAGSIGSELVRQIALNGPRTLVLFDQAETPLFYLEGDMRRFASSVEIVSVVGSITEVDAVRRVFTQFEPDRVFHAAAYKHVPVMEGNPLEAVRTNVFGTYLVAKTAAETGAENFVLVSTDKAVRPANVMGASKNLAEKVVLGLQKSYPKTDFGAVRFGNVLGSNGSVIPIFKKQLAEGKPLTVTHEEITRYFMTIPEAVRLILQASLLPSLRGNVAMLDMGEPVPILELAKKLLRLSGSPARMGRDIVITGLRPGEKLHEELAAPDETVIETKVDRVRIVQHTNGGLPADVADHLARRDILGITAALFAAFPQLRSATEEASPHHVGV